MNIEIIGEKMVRVLLSKFDIQAFNINYENLDYKNPEARRVVFEIIQLIRDLTDIDLSAKRIYVESFKSKDGGCIFYISSKPTIPDGLKATSKYPEGFNEPLIFEFKNFENLCDACKNISNIYSHIILKSNLFVNNQSYILCIYTYFKQDDNIIGVLSEFGEFFGRGAIKSCLITEHCDLILSNNAIEFMIEHII